MKIGICQALKLVESIFFIPLIWDRFGQGKYSKFLPACCKITLFAVQFSKTFRKGMPPDPPGEAPTFRGRFVCDSKIPKFPQNPTMRTEI